MLLDHYISVVLALTGSIACVIESYKKPRIVALQALPWLQICVILYVTSILLSYQFTLLAPYQFLCGLLPNGENIDPRFIAALLVLALVVLCLFVLPPLLATLGAALAQSRQFDNEQT